MDQTEGQIDDRIKGRHAQVRPQASEDPVAAAFEPRSLDPEDWHGFRAQAHRMLDDMIDYTATIRDRPVWQPAPQDRDGRGSRPQFRRPLPAAPTPLHAVHTEFLKDVLPYALGNVHPGFMGWVHGGGTPVGMLAAMLAAGLNANLGGRDHAPVEIERQVTEWMRQLFGFPQGATGLCVTGTSMANLLAVLIARDAALGCDCDSAKGDSDESGSAEDGPPHHFNVRRAGVAAQPRRLVAFGSTATHGCIAKAMDVAGLGSDAFHGVATDARGRIDLVYLEATLKESRREGLTPFLVVATAGTVDTGAIDDLAAVAALCQRERLWLHVDGAYGALAMLAPEVAPRLAGIERADSIAFDFHKWGQVPYDAGFLLVRDGMRHQQAFASPAAYLRRETAGMAAGGPWPCDLGIDLSRGFHALKIWFTFRVYGAAAIGATIAQTCALARTLADRILNTPELELLAPVELNIVCFRYRPRLREQSDALNAQIAVALQEAGRVAPSTTRLHGRVALRAAIVNHRTTQVEIGLLVDETLRLGQELDIPDDRPSHAGRASNPAPTRRSEATPMPEPTDSLSLQLQLNAIEAQLERTPHSTDLLFFQARLFERLGRVADARTHYDELLAREPGNIGALNNLGNLLMTTQTAQEMEQARQAFQRAVVAAPTHLASRANYGNLLIKQGEFEAACEHFRAALRLDPAYRPAHAGLSFILGELGDPAAAAQHRQKAFAGRAVVIAAYRGAQPPIVVLELVSTTGGNIRTDEFLSDRVFQRILVATEFYTPDMVLPPHHLVLNAVGDVDAAADALAGALAVAARTSAPIINPPAAVLGTGRCAIAQRLATVPGVKTAKTVLLSRAQLLDPDVTTLLAAHGLQLPLLLRSPGFHGGDHFLYVEAMEDLRPAVDSLPGLDLLAIAYLDARGADGLVRKYRVMMVDGQLYPLHAAISAHWKIHYFSADMADSAANRAEDAAFLADMAGVLGGKAMAALQQIQNTLGLDYGGIDFGLNSQGEVLLFEANATMAIVLPDKDPRWDYRRRPVEEIYKAVWRMLQSRARPTEAAVPEQPARPFPAGHTPPILQSNP